MVFDVTLMMLMFNVMNSNISSVFVHLWLVCMNFKCSDLFCEDHYYLQVFISLAEDMTFLNLHFVLGYLPSLSLGFFNIGIVI